MIYFIGLDFKDFNESSLNEEFELFAWDYLTDIMDELFQGKANYEIQMGSRPMRDFEQIALFVSFEHETADIARSVADLRDNLMYRWKRIEKAHGDLSGRYVSSHPIYVGFDAGGVTADTINVSRTIDDAECYTTDTIYSYRKGYPEFELEGKSLIDREAIMRRLGIWK